MIPLLVILDGFANVLAACRGSRDAGEEGTREAKTVQGNDRNEASFS